jgi:hypothetical protein
VLTGSLQSASQLPARESFATFSTDSIRIGLTFDPSQHKSREREIPALNRPPPSVPERLDSVSRERGHDIRAVHYRLQRIAIPFGLLSESLLLIPELKAHTLAVDRSRMRFQE